MVETKVVNSVVLAVLMGGVLMFALLVTESPRVEARPGTKCCLPAHVINPGIATCDANNGCPDVSQPPGACATAGWWETAVRAACLSKPDSDCVFSEELSYLLVYKTSCERVYDLFHDCHYCRSVADKSESAHDAVTDCDLLLADECTDFRRV